MTHRLPKMHKLSKFDDCKSNSFLDMSQTKQQNKKEKNACKMQKNLPIVMKIPGAHLHMMNDMCTNFQTNPSNFF